MTEPLDWGDGDYGRTALTLAPAAERLLDLLGVAAGEKLLDVACGTGNVALAAARRGASVTGIDASPGLVAVARQRAQEAGEAVDFRIGEAQSLAVEVGGFDVVTSAFGVIFAPHPDAVAERLLRALRPGGRLGLTTWAPAGPIDALGRLLWSVLPQAPRGEDDPPRWSDREWVLALLRRHEAQDVDVREESLAFTAASPEEWIADQEEHHPVWRWGRRQVDAAVWSDLRERALRLLEDANEDPPGFRTTSRYLVFTGKRACERPDG